MRAHRWLVVVLAVGAALRIAMASSSPPALFYGDSWEYLDKAYGAFPVGLSPLRPSGYPLIIKVLSVGGGPHLWAVITAQRLAGLAVGVLVYLVLTRAQVPRLVAAMSATALVTLDLSAITLEQSIVTEAFFALALFGAAYLALRTPATARTLLASGVLLAAAALMRPAGLFAFPAWVPVSRLEAGRLETAGGRGPGVRHPATCLRRGAPASDRAVRAHRVKRLVPLRARRGDRGAVRRGEDPAGDPFSVRAPRQQ